MLLVVTQLSYSSNSQSPYRLRVTNDGVIRYTVHESYDLVYRKFIRGTRQCYESPSVTVEGFIFPDNQTAEVSLKFWGSGPIFTADLETTGKGMTKVTVYYNFTLEGDWKAVAKGTEKWIVNRGDGKVNNESCPTINDIIKDDF